MPVVYLATVGNVRFSGAYVFIGLAVLTKGLIGIVLPALLLGAFSAVRRDWRMLLDVRLPAGIAIFLLIAAPWFYVVNNATDGRWFADFIYVHHIERYTEWAGHQQPFYYYLRTLPLDFLPWADRLCAPRRLGLFSVSRVEGAAYRIVSFPLVCGGLPVLQRFRFQTRLAISTAVADPGFVGRKLHRRFSVQTVAGEQALPMAEPTVFRRGGGYGLDSAFTCMGHPPRNFLDQPSRGCGVGSGWNSDGRFH